MVRISVSLALALSVTTLIALPANTEAKEFGKIYTNGDWAQSTQEGQFNALAKSPLGINNAFQAANSIATKFVEANSSLLNLNASTKLTVKSSTNGEYFTTVRLSKTFQNIEVLGGEALVHINDGKILFASADSTSLDTLSATAKLSPEEAQAIAYSSYRGQAHKADSPVLKILLAGSQEIKKPVLSYEVTVHDHDGFASENHFIDAENGQVLLVTSNLQTLKNRLVEAASGTDADFDLNESGWKVVYADAGCSSGTIKNAACSKEPKPIGSSAKNAFNNTGVVYDYYNSVHKRDSIDGNGMLIKSAVNFADKFSNAAWVDDQKIMVYGMGDGVEMKDFAGALDVTGHELTHGITARTAALVYADQSGALNESYSDVFGKMIAFNAGKSSDWKLGKDLYVSGSGFVRDMENPVVPNMSKIEFPGASCDQSNDYCGVHDNSGIPSLAAVNIAKKIGVENTRKIYYLTLTQLLRSDSTFHDARIQTQAACEQILGAASQNCGAIASAFDGVGVK